MTEDQIILLIYRELKGDISEQESADLKELRDGDPSIEALAQQIRAEWESASIPEPSIEVDVTADFAKLKARIDQSQNTSSEVLSSENVKSREAKVVQMRKRTPWLSIAAGVAIVAGVLGYLLTRAPDPNELIASTGVGETKEIVMFDKSTITLNESSTLVYYDGLLGKKRQLKLKGEAFFDVIKDSIHPFVINTQLAEVRVMGTSFNVDQNLDTKRLEVSVSTGKVRITPNHSQKFITVTKGVKGIYNQSTGQIYKNGAGDNDHSWRTNVLYFEEEYLRDVLTSLEEHYKVSIILGRKGLEGCKFSARLDNLTVDEALNYLAKQYEMKLSLENEVEYTLNGGYCNATIKYIQ